ncbi:high-affinity choline transporter 1-like isoform X1 [Biomphalaria glabrata]|uniref:High-affinity choline transporter 1-like isoform X1 n=2 Tax=Biomphalaria glabrata TaxID=6526 RepID=A0A9W2ZN45_BIOGL|nr:high-affinity choline transporter 1-like isoform X1 [Biomphalaria glabrata]XP_055876379.1 high-affinity choline transporter 1-like isoform X1 [Biomphalaria glabrata]XP_055876380.1 high-affinity choline transporter 1-like isoform X1 [Biomphalaria glabrata]XP_055876381.1 high-affinity choline transporter 1-like isoform X1 [Biomphalaria glabrata]XP_055876382.1 high-affinity choline transporter 1-like isoform X1 [Biomphalaria glabrata]
MSVNIPGIVSVALFYVAILILGVIAGRKTSKNSSKNALLVADRSLNLFVSVFTVTATLVGGGYINGSAESAAYSGLVWTQAPIGYCLSLIVGAFCHIPKMRSENYVTMFDPFQLKYGKKVGAILFIPQILGDLFWTAAVLAALGATISIILSLDATVSIVVSSAVAVIYTVFGGLYSVAYTDVLQLIFIAVGLIIAFPFSLSHPAVDLSTIQNSWLGTVPTSSIASYIDTLLLCVLGGLPWQSLFQRSLACKTVSIAKWSAFLSGFFSLFLAIPPIMMGLAAKATDWNSTDYKGPIPIPDDQRIYILPLALSYLTPLPVGIIGIGVVSAAVMSSADSCILSTSSVFTKNIYSDIIRPKASERELVWVLRISVVVVGVMGTIIAISATTIYGLYVLCSDLMYVTLFPQLTLVLWMPSCNAYGCVAGFFLSFILRLLCGEPVLGVPAALRFPYYDVENNVQLFPFRTFCMLLGTLTIVVVSMATNYVFLSKKVPAKYDFLKCYKQRTIRMHISDEQVDHTYVVPGDKTETANI